MPNYFMVSDDGSRELSATKYSDAVEEALNSVGWFVMTEEDTQELFEENEK